MEMKKLFLISILWALFLAVLGSLTVGAKPKPVSSSRVVVAYVTSWSQVIPDPQVMTHLNYAFGGVSQTFNGVEISNPQRLKAMVALKKQNPKLKVLLSVGGWGAGRFSEIAACDKNRMAFAADCKRVVKEMGLDGIDIDWEYPTQSSANISSSPDDTGNFTLLMRDLRKALGKSKLLTCATIASGEFIDFKDCISYLDFVNVMSYDMAGLSKHHSALYPSDISGWMTTSQAVESHLKKGVPANKLVVGMAFYGRNGTDYQPYSKLLQVKKCEFEKWSEQSKVPYLVDGEGKMILGFENAKSLAIKCQYIINHHLRGGMYWEYADDNEQGDLRNTVAKYLLGIPVVSQQHAIGYAADYASAPRFKVLFVWNPHAEEAHLQFAQQALEFFHKLSYGEGFKYDKTTDFGQYVHRLHDYDVIVMLNAQPQGDIQRKAFEEYMEQGGGWIGFHAAAYNDANTHWEWFNKFLGCGKFYCNNWPPQPALLRVDDTEHSITKTLPKEFVAPACEYYQWKPSPGKNREVQVLLSVSPKMYPFGIKDIVKWGDFPVVWTNKKYHMVYLNMGHGNETFIDATQNLLFVNAFRWVADKIKPLHN